PRHTEGAHAIDERDEARSREIGRAFEIATPFISVLIALLIGSLVIALSGGSPVAAFAAMFKGAFGSQRQIGETLLRATPLIFTGLAVAYGFRAGLFNIGAEGQLFMGGLAAAFLGVQLGSLPAPVAVPLILAGAMLAGAGWAFVPALMKARIGAHEVITTMMFTYIARYTVSWLVTGPLKAPGSVPQTTMIAVSSRLPRLSELFGFLQPSRAHLGIVVAVIAAVVTWLLLRYTTVGYEARAVGFNPLASEAGGISIAATTVKSLCISGALAALAGASEVMGVHYLLFDQFSSGFGFTGIAVALLAKTNPLGVIPAALLFGAMSAGAGTMQLEAHVSQKVIALIQGLIVFLVGAQLIVTWVIA
ncbi:MAG: ABC transporter permease, partial [Actinobacteria bacterium]